MHFIRRLYHGHHDFTIDHADNRGSTQGLKLLKEIEELKSSNVVNKLKNERGAGRKEMFTEEQKARVKMLRLQGKSYRAIAKDMNCSVATVHKIINEQ